jgi:hypothetical protein
MLHPHVAEASGTPRHPNTMALIADLDRQLAEACFSVLTLFSLDVYLIDENLVSAHGVQEYRS